MAQPLRLKAGDVLHVEVTASEESAKLHTGDYVIARDGSIYGRSFGRVTVVDLTVAEAQSKVRRALSRFVQPREVYVSLKIEGKAFVFLYVAGSDEDQVAATGSIPRGPLEWSADLTLKRVASTITLNRNSDQWSISLVRGDREIANRSLDALMSDKREPDVRLQPNDLVVLSPTRSVKVWVNGLVRKPGTYRLTTGANVSKAIVQAGGMVLDVGQVPIENQDVRVKIRRAGGAEVDVPIGPDGSPEPTELKDGDEVLVSVVPIVRVSVLGQVSKPGEYVTRGEPTLLRAISLAGGITPEGTSRQVMVYRNGDMLQIDASAPEGGLPNKPFELQSGDLVFVRRNEDVIYALGAVKKPGKVVMLPNKTYTLNDVLAEVGGLADDGTLRRIVVARPGPDGKAVVEQFNLDEYLKDGKIAANPVLHPGDAVLFGHPNGLKPELIQQLLSNLILFYSVLRR